MPEGQWSRFVDSYPQSLVGVDQKAHGTYLEYQSDRFLAKLLLRCVGRGTHMTEQKILQGEREIFCR